MIESAMFSIDATPLADSNALQLPPVPPAISRDINHISLRIPPATQEIDWNQNRGTDSMIPAAGPRMTVLYRELDSWLQTNRLASTREVCGEVLLLIHKHFGEYSPAIIQTDRDLKNAVEIRERLRAERDKKFRGENEITVFAAEILVGRPALAPWLSLGGTRLEFSSALLRSYGDREKTNLGTRYNALLEEIATLPGDDSRAKDTEQNILNLDRQIAQQELRFRCGRPDDSLQTLQQLAERFLAERDALQKELAAADERVLSFAGTMNESAKRPQAANPESLAYGSAICSDFAPLAAGILRNLNIPHIVATGAEHVYVLLPSEKAVFEATAPNIEQGGWAPIEQAPANEPAPATAKALPGTFRTARGSTYTVSYAEGSPQFDGMSRDPAVQQLYREIEARQIRDNRKLVWELTHPATCPFPF